MMHAYNQALKRISNPRALQEFCGARGRIIDELEAEGFTRHQVYNAVKAGTLVNLNRYDQWGRERHGAGLYADPQASDQADDYTNDARALEDVWRSL